MSSGVSTNSQSVSKKICHFKTSPDFAKLTTLRRGHHQPAISWWCMPVHISACFVPAVQFACVCICVLICTACAAYIAYKFHTMSYVMSVMLPLIVEPDVGHMNIGPGCMLQRIYVHKSLMLSGLATIALGIMGLAPLKCDLFVLVKIQAAFPLFTQTEDSSTCRQPRRADSARRSRACLPCAWFCAQVPACA